MDIEKHQKMMQVVNRGATTRVALTVVMPHLDYLENECLSTLKSDFRSGNTDQVKMLVKIAQLCNLEDIRNRLTAEVNRGETIGKELIENG